MNLPRALTLLMTFSLLLQPIFPVMALSPVERIHSIAVAQPPAALTALPTEIAAPKPAAYGVHLPIRYQSGEEAAPQPPAPVVSPHEALQTTAAAHGLLFIENVGQFDLSNTVTPTLTFWHMFDLPAGSIGTVEASADGGLTWKPAYTQTASLTVWTPITIDLHAYAGQKLTLAFHLQQVGTGSSVQSGSRTISEASSAVAADHIAQFDWTQISVLLIGGLGFVALRRQRRDRRVIFLLVTMGVLLVSCVRVGPSPFYDYNRLDSVKGSVELIVPAESRPLHAQLSPDGRWLWIDHWYDEQQGYRYSLIDLVNDRLYENLGQGSAARWLDNEHLMIGTQMLRVTDMAQWKLQRIEPPAGSLGKLAVAKHIYATDMDSSFYWLTTTDPTLPYVIWSEFGASPGATNEQLEMFLTNKPHTVITGTDFINGWTQPAYSPDQRYYIKVAPADPTPPGPKDNPLLQYPYSAMFDASTNQQVAHAYKWGWHSIFLGWAYDGSGAYFLYQPRGASGDLIYQKWPIYKVLVPGTQPRGTPAPATFTPPPTFTPAPPSATPVGFLSISVLMIGAVSVVATRHQRRRWWKIISVGVIGTTLTSCVGPSLFYDYNRLDLVKGQAELVVPAEGALHARLSLDGRWLWLGHEFDEKRGYRFSLVDLEHNQLYEDVGEGGTPAMWLDDDHIAISQSILRVSDMARWKLQDIEPPQGSLGELSGANHIYAVDMNDRYWLMTTDPALPYVIRASGFGVASGIPVPTIEAPLETFLTNIPHTIITRDPGLGYTDRAYSPDGNYYIKDGPFEDPTHNLTQGGCVIYDANAQAVAYGYKYGWSTIFVGWASDSSGAYFLYMPRSPDGDAMYRKWPIYKVLVPGAQPRGTPAPATFTPPPTFTPAPASATPVGQIDAVQPVAFRSQSGTSGWYIDDVSLADAAAPAPTPTPTPDPDGSFPTTSVLDNFNRANGGLGG